MFFFGKMLVHWNWIVLGTWILIFFLSICILLWIMLLYNSNFSWYKIKGGIIIKKRWKQEWNILFYWIFNALLWEIPIFQSTLEWSHFCNFSSSHERHFETGQHCVLVCTACPPLSSWLYWQLLPWSMVWAVRKHWEGCLSISLEKRLWQQWATSAEARQKRCLDNGTKMEEPCWLQSWLWKVWGEGFNNFIYHLHCSSSAKRKQWES